MKRFSTSGRNCVNNSHWRRGTKIARLLTLLCLAVAGQSFAQLTANAITWDVVGLDHNRPLTSGPELFPVGAEVCSAVATTNVTVDFVWMDGNDNGWDFAPGDPYINLRPGSLTSLTFASIGAGECVDAYFELQLTRSASAFEYSREYVIAATDLSGMVSTPSPRAIYVERLVSQNRNTTQQIRYGQQADKSDWVVLGAGAGINLALGETYFLELTTQTSTAYEELESFLTLSNTIFQVKSVETTYSTLTAPVSRVPVPNPRLWADGCLWESDLDSPNYNSCLADGKAGGVVVTIYEISVISGGGDSVGLEALIYDRSGGSFHYNTDFSQSPGELNPYDPTGAGFSKIFLPATTSIGGISRLRFTITNPNPVEISAYNFIDNLPSGVEVASPPDASSSCGGTWSPAAGETSLAFDGGTIGANGNCTILVNVTSAAEATYENTSNSLFIDNFDTGQVAEATLVVNDAPPPPACAPGTELARWTMATTQPTTTPPAPFSLHASADPLVTVASFTAASGATNSINTTVGNLINSWSGTGWGEATLPVTTGPGSADASYFEFTLDTSAFASNLSEPLGISIDVNPTPQGDWAQPANITANVHASADGGSFSTITNFNPVVRTTWTTLTGTVTPGFSTTTFRINITGRNGPKPNATFLIDNIIFTGCGPANPADVLDPPELTKAFSPDLIGVGHTSTLSFTLSNPNPSDALTGATFQDNLPAGMTVASPANESTTCGGPPTWAPGAGATLLDFSGGIIPANSSCTVSVDVTSSTVGVSANISDFIYAAESGANNGPTGSASASLEVLASPDIAKDFDPDLVLLTITPDNASTLSFTITNPNPADPIGGVSFADTFPAGLVVAASPNASTTGCGSPAWAPAAGAGSVTFTGGTIASGADCVVTVDVTGPAGVYANVSGVVSHVVSGVSATNGDTASATLVIDNPIPKVSIFKQVGLTNDPNGAWSNYLAVEVGDQVYYKLTVENIGETVLTDIAVSDPTVDTSSCTWPASLPVADAASPEAHISVCVVGPVDVAVAGVVPNTATATGDFGITEVTDEDSATRATAELGLNKSASPTTFTASGQVITYTFTVTNDGDAILPGPASINDPLVPGAVCPDLTTIGNNDNFFDPSESIDCTGTYTTQGGDVTTGSITNTASASVADFDSPDDSATVILPIPALTIAKTQTSGPDPVTAADDVLGYTIVVTNTGTLSQTGATVSDTLPDGTAGTLSGPTESITTNSILEVGETWTYTISYTVTQADIDAGTALVNTASVVTPEVPGPTTDTETTPVTPPAALTIAKTQTSGPNPVTAVNDVLGYTIVVTNTGTANQTGVTVGDTLPDGTAGTLAGPTESITTNSILDVGETWTYTISYTVTQADIDDGNALVNTASVVTPEVPGPTTDTETTPVTPPTVAVSASKVSLPADGTPVAVGDTITYALILAVSNGPTTADVVLTDTLGAGLTFGSVISNPDGFVAGGTGNVRTFTLTGNAVEGIYMVEYTAVVNVDATGATVNNNLFVTGGGDPNPECGSCSTDHPLESEVEAIPTASILGLLLMIVLLTGVAAFRMRRV